MAPPPKRHRKGSLGGNPLRDDAEHTEPVSPQRDAEWKRTDAAPEEAAATSDGERLATIDANALPLPYKSDVEAGPLSDRERQDLADCEAAIETLRVAFWIAGRALQVVRDARLYREHYTSFDDYVEERWGMQRSYAHKLIRAWPLAQQIEPIAPKTVNEAQIRQLLPVANRHGDAAAVTVYKTIATTDGVRITADLIQGAVSVIPSGRFDPDQTIAQIRAFLAGELQPPAPTVAPAEVFTAEVRRVRSIMRRTVGAPLAERRKFADALRELADELEKAE